MNVKDMIQTCSASPSQWEGSLTDGRMFYARYRHGFLSITVSKNATTNIDDAIIEESDSIYGEQLGDEYDGILDESLLIEKMKESGFTFEY